MRRGSSSSSLVGGVGGPGLVGGVGGPGPGKPQRKGEEAHDYVVRILVLGDTGVGKSSLMVRFSDDKFEQGGLVTTAGVDFRTRYITCEGRRVKLQLWDTAGQQRFHKITQAYYKDAHAILAVYAVDDKHSFRNISYWLEQITQHADRNRVAIAMVGNKIDLREKATGDHAGDHAASPLSFADGAEMSRNFAVPYFEASAKTASGVSDLYLGIAGVCVKRQIEEASRAESFGGGEEMRRGEREKSRRLSGCVMQ